MHGIMILLDIADFRNFCLVCDEECYFDILKTQLATQSTMHTKYTNNCCEFLQCALERSMSEAQHVTEAGGSGGGGGGGGGGFRGEGESGKGECAGSHGDMVKN